MGLPLFNAPPRWPLAKLPTPVNEMPRLSRTLGGPRLLVKRDDLTGLAGGGNKARKLEYLIADAVAKKCDVLITAGGPQSNHCRQAAAAAAMAGLECHLVIGGEPQPAEGNLLIDRLLGASIHWTPKHHRNARMHSLAQEFAAAGKSPYVCPIGGSTPLGAIGYVQAMLELIEQLRENNLGVDHILFATSSGGTQAGLALGAAMARFGGQLTAVSIDQLPDEQSEDKFLAHVRAIADEAAQLLNLEITPSPRYFNTVYDYLGDGYGIVGELEREATRLLARTEGVLVGPVYTARAAGAMIDFIRRGDFGRDETVLFWHTGDDIAIHAYGANLM